jgi:hypothetical protein
VKVHVQRVKKLIILFNKLSLFSFRGLFYVFIYIVHSFAKPSKASPKKVSTRVTSFALIVQANMSRIASVESVLQEKDFEAV